jgi:hypothetical protein
MHKLTVRSSFKISRVILGLLLTLGLIALVDQGFADHVEFGKGLFLEDLPLDIELVMNYQDLCRLEDGPDCPDISAILSYSTEVQENHSIPIIVKSRGNWRLNRDNCWIPPLFLIFPREDVSGTIFAGQDLLPLTTHCGGRLIRNDDYVLKEYLAYRIYNLFSEKSVRVRLAVTRYRKPDENKSGKPHYAFFNEHFHSVAARNDAELWETPKLDLAQTDPMETATMELFQYMIGNTDYSELGQHNIMLLRTADGQVTTLPFDFDFSGLVYAKYAGPNPNLPLKSTKERLYRGFCHPGLDWDELFRKFTDRKAEVFGLIESTPGLSRRAQKSTHKFLNKFYAILDSPKKRQEKIVDACRVIELPD